MRDVLHRNPRAGYFGVVSNAPISSTAVRVRVLSGLQTKRLLTARMFILIVALRAFPVIFSPGFRLLPRRCHVFLSFLFFSLSLSLRSFSGLRANLVPVTGSVRAVALADALIGLFSAGVIYSEAPFAEIDGCGTRAPRGGYMLQHLLFQDRRGA